MESFKIKICQVANTDMAIRFLLLNQINFLKKQGYDVSAVCSPGELIKDIKDIKIKTIKFNRGFNAFSHLISFFKLYFYFKKEKFQIVHTHTPVPGLLAQLAAKISKVPIIVNTVHGFYFNENTHFLKRKFFILTERIAAKCSDVIFFQSKEDMETAIKEKICSELKIRHLGNGINIQKFNMEDFIKNKKKEYRIIGTVGRLVKEKGYLELFQAFKKVLDKFPKTKLLVIGPEEPGKRDKIKKQKINNVLFLGQRTDIHKLYPLFDVFVLASHREGFPRAVIEAQTSGVPVIATNIRGCREIIEHNKTGILISLKNPDKIAQAIIYLFENPEIAKQIAENARNKAIKEFDENLIFNRIKTEYQRLIKEKL